VIGPFSDGEGTFSLSEFVSCLFTVMLYMNRWHACLVSNDETWPQGAAEPLMSHVHNSKRQILYM
jgi:hypothetical protein